MERAQVSCWRWGVSMKILKKYLFEGDEHIVIDIMGTELNEVMTWKEVQKEVRVITREARSLLGDYMASIHFDAVDLEQQIFLVSLEGKAKAIAIQLEGDLKYPDSKSNIIEGLIKKGFVEAD